MLEVQIYKKLAEFDLDVSFQVNDNILGLMGASGSGKSMTLKCIAGIETPDQGRIVLNDRVLFDSEKKINVPIQKRNVGYMFQSYALFPNMNVYENISVGLRARKVKDVDIVVQKVMQQFRIFELASRYPKQLSGGQRQRVALGRAIVRNAKVFLMDEPLSNLDAKLRVQMRSEIIQLHERIGATTIYVTHDQTEAMAMAGRIVVMKGGYIQQIGSPKEIYNNPANLFVAGFLGAPATNFIKGVYKNGFFYVDDMKIDIPLMYREKLSSYQGKEIIMGIRPEDLHGEGIVADTYPSANFDFEIEVAELLGHEYILHGALNGQKMCAKVNSRLEPEAHSTIKLTMDLSKIHFFDIETENRID
mgnify:CR=1 FL=1